MTIAEAVARLETVSPLATNPDILAHQRELDAARRQKADTAAVELERAEDLEVLDSAKGRALGRLGVLEVTPEKRADAVAALEAARRAAVDAAQRFDALNAATSALQQRVYDDTKRECLEIVRDVVDQMHQNIRSLEEGRAVLQTVLNKGVVNLRLVEGLAAGVSKAFRVAADKVLAHP